RVGGGSAPRPWPPDVAAFADTLADWLRPAGISRTALIGNSLGAQVIVELAARFPEVVDRAVLIGPTMDPGCRTVLQLLVRAARDIPWESPALWPVFLTDQISADPLRTLRTLLHAFHDGMAENLPHVCVPTL